MALTYTWKLKALKKADTPEVQGIIIGTQWTLTGTDEDGYSGDFQGATPFNLTEVDPDSFTPYSELTEAQVLGWIQAVVVGSYKEHIDQQIMKQILAKRSPVVEVSENELPWANQPVIEETP
jgi:hypothetical protein